MRHDATTVDGYLAALPDDRRAAIEAVRAVILENLDASCVETIGYGMLAYVVPKSVYPPGYHVDRTKGVPLASLASQKNHMALYLMGCYGLPDEEERFRAEWAEAVAAGRAKKLDMGKSCVRFKRLDDVPLDVVGAHFRRLTADRFIAHYEATLRR
ncbi:MAG: DUF1801 domain-containing protein [Myxococcales bacterium]|nr:DUF1801 domain-containing protein [Myxococcales bacterium]MCB9736133.1 DUF1801 domain-containing protein [Deltaproteobacteria bacterium]